MSIFDTQDNHSEAENIYETLKSKAPNQKAGEEARCLSAYFDLWGGNDLIDVPDTAYRTAKTPISIETAREVMTLLGTDASKIFQAHSLWQDSIMVVNSEWKKVIPPYPITYNEDGTATI